MKKQLIKLFEKNAEWSSLEYLSCHVPNIGDVIRNYHSHYLVKQRGWDINNSFVVLTIEEIQL